MVSLPDTSEVIGVTGTIRSKPRFRVPCSIRQHALARSLQRPHLDDPEPSQSSVRTSNNLAHPSPTAPCLHHATRTATSTTSPKSKPDKTEATPCAVHD